MVNDSTYHLMRIQIVNRLGTRLCYEQLVSYARIVVDREIVLCPRKVVHPVSYSVSKRNNEGQIVVSVVVIGGLVAGIHVAEAVIEVATCRPTRSRVQVKCLSDHLEIREYH